MALRVVNFETQYVSFPTQSFGTQIMHFQVAPNTPFIVSTNVFVTNYFQPPVPVHYGPLPALTGLLTLTTILFLALYLRSTRKILKASQ